MLRRMVCEVRYQDGQLYFDHCGRFLKSLLNEDPAWVVAGDPTTQGTSVFNIRTEMQLGVSMHAASLTLDKTAADEIIDDAEVAMFIEGAETALGIVLDELQVAQIGRLGYRENYYFSFETKEESEHWIRDLGVFTVVPGLYQAFKGEAELTSLAVTIQAEECRYRVALNGVERSAQIPVGESVVNMRASSLPTNQKEALRQSLKQKRQRQINSAFSAVLDVDAFLVDPPAVNIRDFVKQQASENLNRFRAALPSEQQRKGK